MLSIKAPNIHPKVNLVQIIYISEILTLSRSAQLNEHLSFASHVPSLESVNISVVNKTIP